MYIISAFILADWKKKVCCHWGVFKGLNALWRERKGKCSIQTQQYLIKESKKVEIV